MRWIACLIAGALGAVPASGFGQTLDPEPFATPAPGSVVEQMLRMSILGNPGADAAIAAWLAAHPQAPNADRAALYHRLCGAYGLRTWNSLRVHVCSEAARLGNVSGDANSARMAAALATAPPIRAIGTTALSLEDNPLGSKSVDVTVNGVTLPWFMDTGAEITVLSQSSADRLDVRYRADSVQVGTSTASTEGRLAVIDLLRIGDASVENVPVLVLPDGRLTAGSFRIPAILGLQVFVAFRRMAWLDGGSRLVLGNDAPRIARATSRIYWHEDGLGIPVEIGELVRGAHFDTGANSSFLWTLGRGLLTADQRASLSTRTIRLGGAGGIVERQSQELPVWRSAIAGASITLKCVTIDDRTSSSVGRIGSDVLPQFRRLILDFETMTVEAEPMSRQVHEKREASHTAACR